MYTKYYYNRNPSTAIKINKSHSTEHFYNHNTTRSTNYQPSPYPTNLQCRACKLQSQKTLIDVPSNQQYTKRVKFSTLPNSQYYKINDNNELANVKKSKRYLQELLENNRKEYKQTLDEYQHKIQSISVQLFDKNLQIEQMKKQYQLQLAKHQYSYPINNNSLVATYLQDNQPKADKSQQQKQALRSKNKQLKDRIKELNQEREMLRQQQSQNKRLSVEYTLKQQKYKQYEVYQRQYESMRMLINKIQNDKEQIQKRHLKQTKQHQQTHRQQLQSLRDKINELINIIEDKDRQIQVKERQIVRLKEEAKMTLQLQYQKMQELIDDKDEAIDKLEYKIRCIQSEINFIKNKYGHLLLINKNNGQFYVQEQGSAVQESSYGLERMVGRFNATTTRQSMLGMNISPIRKR